MAKAAIYALQDGDCGTAAFFLGQMAHYITDGSCFYHIVPFTSTEDVSSYAPYLESKVLDRTCGRSWGSISYNRAHRQAIFRVQAETYVYLYPFLNPGQLAIRMAYNTFFGAELSVLFNEEGQYDYDWMHNVFKNYFYTSNKFWPIDQSWLSWSGEFPIPYLFILRLEESLNRAITNVASALNWVMDHVPSFTCKSGPSDPPDEYFRRLAADLLLQGAFKAIAFIGIYAAMYSVSVTSSKILK